MQCRRWFTERTAHNHNAYALLASDNKRKAESTEKCKCFYNENFKSIYCCAAQKVFNSFSLLAPAAVSYEGERQARA